MLLIILLFIGVVCFVIAFGKVEKLSSTELPFHSLSKYYGYFLTSWALLPALILLFIWGYFENNLISMLILKSSSELQALTISEQGLVLNEIWLLIREGGVDPGHELKNSVELGVKYLWQSAILKTVCVLATSILIASIAYRHISATFKARNYIERLIVRTLLLTTTIAILTTLGIVFSLLFEAMQFFVQIPLTDFLFATHWSPQISIREDQVGSSGAFGAIPLFWGTLFISTIAMIVALPLGAFSAIYLSEYASKNFRARAKPIIEILAGIPTVVYGFFAALTVGPMVREFGSSIKRIGERLGIDFLANLSVSTESALAVGLVMGVMIIPFILSLSDDAIQAVPETMRHSSIALGSTRAETIWKIIIPAALPGIVGGFLLAVSRAIGETMIVVMAAGVAANLTANPFESVTTVTTQIVSLLTGDQEFDSVKTLAAFALGLTLFITTLFLNIIALKIVRRYREQYE